MVRQAGFTINRQSRNAALRKGLVERPEDWRWSSYNNFALEKSRIAACPI